MVEFNLKPILILILLIIAISPVLAAEENKTHFTITNVGEGPLFDEGKKIIEIAYSNLGYTVEFVELQAEDALQRTNEGTIDAEMFRVSGIEKTYTNLIPVPVPFVIVENNLFVRNDWSKEITEWNDLIDIINDENDLGIRIGLVKGEEQADSRNIPYTKFETLEEGLQMLSNGEIDLVYEESLTALKTLEELEIKNVKKLETPLDLVALYHYVHKDNSFIVPELEKEFTDIIAKELQIEKEKIELTEEEKQWLAEHQYMRLGIDPNWPPYDFVDDLGHYKGISSEYIKILSKELNVVMAPQTNLNWAEMIEKAEQGEIDVITNILPLEDKSDYLLFTEPYLRLETSVIMKNDAELVKDLSELEGKTIAIVKGYGGEYLLKRDYPDIIQIEVDSIEEGLLAVSKGEIDSIMDTYAVTKYHTKKLRITNLKVAFIAEYKANLAFGVRKDWPELVTIINKKLASITYEEEKEIEELWVDVNVEEVTNWVLIRNILLTVSSIIIVIILWNRNLAKAVKVRTEELEKTNKKLQKKTNKLERFVNVSIGREKKIIELKKHIKKRGKK